MKYCKSSTLNSELSVLGFGVRQLPLTNKAESIEMIRYAIDNGVNYLDLGYLGIEKYESLIGLVNEALQNGYRERVKIAIHLLSPLMNSFGDLDYYLQKQLQLLQSDCVDFCVLWGLNRGSWSKLRKLDVLGWAESVIRDGRVAKLGFYFHDDLIILREVLEAFDKWAFCQFQFSYMDVDTRPGLSGLRYAASKGLAVFAVEPFLGGRLLREHESTAEVWESMPQKRSVDEWCLRWVWDHPEVSTVVVDMGTLKQVVEYVTLANKAEPNSLTIQEHIVFNRVRDLLRKLRPIPCAGCYSCMPCPSGVDVPRIFEIYNDAIIYSDIETARFYYDIERHNIRSCIECGKCVNTCPRKIPITDWLKEAHKLLAA